MLRGDFIKRPPAATRSRRGSCAPTSSVRPDPQDPAADEQQAERAGQDHGIWRRVLLVAYLQRFGSEEQVAVGSATLVGDKHPARA